MYPNFQTNGSCLIYGLIRIIIAYACYAVLCCAVAAAMRKPTVTCGEQTVCIQSASYRGLLEPEPCEDDEDEPWPPCEEEEVL